MEIILSRLGEEILDANEGAQRTNFRIKKQML
jgi:hypothetical protein